MPLNSLLTCQGRGTIGQSDITFMATSIKVRKSRNILWNLHFIVPFVILLIPLKNYHLWFYRPHHRGLARICRAVRRPEQLLRASLNGGRNRKWRRISDTPDSRRRFSGCPSLRHLRISLLRRRRRRHFALQLGLGHELSHRARRLRFACRESGAHGYL